jgi:uncharacterized YceG family protein
MNSTPPRSPRPGRRNVRLTRRGRIVATAAAGTVVATLVAATVALTVPDDSADGSDAPRSLTVAEGWRSGQVYEAVDKALHLALGSTRAAAASAKLKLPTEAHGNPEGYLYPTTYPLLPGTTPAALLNRMVETAARKFGGRMAASERNDMNTYQAVTVASVVQAESGAPKDMGKVSRIIHNRLARGMPLQMDSTVDYALNRPAAPAGERDTAIDSPYNSYSQMGLPPTPIGNPGEEALRAALAPAPGDWLYFVTVAPGDTRFSATYEQQMANVAELKHRGPPAHASS